MGVLRGWRPRGHAGVWRSLSLIPGTRTTRLVSRFRPVIGHRAVDRRRGTLPASFTLLYEYTHTELAESTVTYLGGWQCLEPSNVQFCRVGT
jgi:hypothetical protein